MFDDPKKELRELEDQLLAARTDDEKFEEVYGSVLQEFGPAAQADDEPDIRNFANGYGRAVPKAPPQPFYGYEETAVSSSKGTRGLTILAGIECAAIVAVALYWVFHFL